MFSRPDMICPYQVLQPHQEPFSSLLFIPATELSLLQALCSLGTQMLFLECSCPSLSSCFFRSQHKCPSSGKVQVHQVRSLLLWSPSTLNFLSLGLSDLQLYIFSDYMINVYVAESTLGCGSNPRSREQRGCLPVSIFPYQAEGLAYRRGPQ